MAFDKSGWGRISAGVNDSNIVVYGYTTTDPIATVTASGYFNPINDVLGGDDIVFVEASDKVQLLVTSLSGTTINTADLVDSSVDDSSITTAKIADAAVTDAKIASVSGAKLTAATVPAGAMAAGLVPKYSKLFTTTGGGTSETITVTGLATDDVVFVVRNTPGASPVTVSDAKVSAADTITLTFSADPSTDHKFNVIVFTPLN